MIKNGRAHFREFRKLVGKETRRQQEVREKEMKTRIKGGRTGRRNNRYLTTKTHHNNLIRNHNSHLLSSYYVPCTVLKERCETNGTFLYF